MTRGLLLVTCVALAGCGGQSGDGVKGGAKTSENGLVSSGVATVPAAAPAQKSKVDCRRVKGQTAPEGQPADDILGVRHGMPLDQVRSVLSCANSNYMFEEQEQMSGSPELASSRRVTLLADAGLDKVRVDFAGARGQERAIRAVRSVEYAAGSEPLASVVVSTIEKKYGPFDPPQYGSTSEIRGSKLFSLDGQRMGRENTDYGNCISNVGSGHHSSYTIGNCGLVLTYYVRRKPDNADLAQNFWLIAMSQGVALRELRAADAQAAANATAAATAAAEAGEAPKL